MPNPAPQVIQQQITPPGFGSAATGNLYRPIVDEVALATVQAAWAVVSLRGPMRI